MYLSEQEAWYKQMIDERVEKGKILVLDYEISNGNRCNIYNTNGQAILMGLTMENAYWVVNGICNFMSRFEGFEEV